MNQLIEAIKKGLEAKGNGPCGGCGRAYVCLSEKADRKTLNIFKKVMKACNLRYLGRAYGTGTRAAYVGYDNGTGRPMAQAEAIAKNLNALGMVVYADGVGD